MSPPRDSHTNRFASREVAFGGVTYPSVAAAALAHGLSESALYYRLERGIPLDAPLSGVRQSKTVVIDGVEYPSINKAAKAIGISHTALRLRLKKSESTLPMRKRGRPSTSERPSERLTLPFELDEEAIAFVEEHPSGATLDEIGEFFGVTHERIRQIEESALAKIRAAMRGHRD